MNQGVWYCGNIVVATFLCLNISFLSATGAPINIAEFNLERERERAVTFIDKPFEEGLTVNNRTIKCAGTIQGSHYPSPMYTCNNISVDDEKLYHGYSTDSSRNKPQCVSGCPCGSNSGRPNDLHALCNAMLRKQGVMESLVAAYVVKPSCNLEGKANKRVKFYLDDDGSSVWEDIIAPNGYINTLQCLTDKHKELT